MPGDDNDDYDKEWQEGLSGDNTSESESESESVEKDDNDKDDEAGQRRIHHPPHEETVYLGSDASFKLDEEFANKGSKSVNLTEVDDNERLRATRQELRKRRREGKKLKEIYQRRDKRKKEARSRKMGYSTMLVDELQRYQRGKLDSPSSENSVICNYSIEDNLVRSRSRRSGNPFRAIDDDFLLFQSHWPSKSKTVG